MFDDGDARRVGGQFDEVEGLVFLVGLGKNYSGRKVFGILQMLSSVIR